MTHSDKATNLIMEFEGCVLTSYQDQNNVWTIGYGHTENVTPGVTITKAQAVLYLNSDIISADSIINNLVKVPLTQNQFDALVSFVFNIGYSHFVLSTTLKELNLKNYNAAADALLLWKKAAGKTDPGLVRRRIAERNLFLQG